MIVVSNHCAKRDLKVVAFFNSAKKIKGFGYVALVSEQIETPKKICKNKTYSLL